MEKIITREGVLGELCKRDFYTFVREFWEDADTSTPVWNWHMKYLADYIQEVGNRVIKGLPKVSDTIVNIAPGTSKSMIISVLFPAWLFAVDPKIRIISASFSYNTALELSIKTRSLMQSEKYKKVFPNTRIAKDEGAKGHYKTTMGGGRLTTSTGSNIIGMHGDIILCDDIQNLDSVYSDADRLRVNRWVTGTLSTRKTDKINTPMVYVQQRLHPLDFTSHLLSLGGEYKHIVLPAILTDKVKPSSLAGNYKKNKGFLDINRLNQTHLDELFRMLGTANYNAQVLQDPEDESTSIIKRDWLNVTPNIPSGDIKESKELYYIIDTAYGGDKSDYSVILECFKYNNNLYITNVVRSQAEFPDLIKLIKATIKVQYAKKVYIEAKASGKSIIQTLKQQTKLNIIELVPTDNKLVRLNAISPYVESGRVFIAQSSWTEKLIQEVVSNYPKNDDMRDCFTYAVDELLIKGESYGKYNIG